MQSENEMDHRAAMAEFLSAALSERRDRLVGFALSPKKKTQQKIIKLVYHDLECMLRPEVVVNALPAAAWNSRAFLFCEPFDIGTEFPSLKEAIDHPKGNDERLVITHDGQFGCLRTELSGDILVAIKKRK